MIRVNMVKKKSNLIIMLLLTICTIVLGIIFSRVKAEIRRKADIEAFESTLKKNITKIKMRIAIDLPEYVEFSDIDLIEEVIVCLKTIKIGSVAKYLAHCYSGGGTVIYIYPNDSPQMAVVIRGDKIEINKTYYVIESFDWESLNKIYKKGVERGYLKDIITNSPKND